MRVHAGDDDVHLLKHRIGQVKRTVCQDVDFHTGKNCNSFDLLIGRANALYVLNRTFVIETIRKGQILGMVGDGHVFVALCLGSLGHLFNRISAIGFDRVHVQVALEVLFRM